MTSKFKTLDESSFNDDDATDELEALDPEAYRAARIDDEATIQIEALVDPYDGHDDSNDSEHSATILSLRSDLESRTEAIQTLEADIERLQRRWKELEVQLETKEVAHAELEQEALVLRETVADSATSVEQLTRELSETQSALADTKAQAESATRSDSDGQRRITDLEAQTQAQASTLADLTEQLAKQTESLTQAEQVREKAVAGAAAATDEASQVQTKFKDLNLANDELRTSLSQVLADLKTEQHGCARTTELAANRLTEIDALRARIFNVNESQAATRQHLTDTRSELETIRVEAATVRENTLHAGAALNRALQEIEQLQGQRTELQSSLEAQEAQVRELNAAAKTAALEHLEASGQRDAVTEQLSAAKARERSLGESLASAEQRIGDQDSALQAAQIAHEKLNASLTIRDSESADLTSKLANANETINELDASVTEMDAERASLRDEIAALSQTRTEIEQRLQHVTVDSSDLSDQLIESKRVETDLRSQLAAQTSTLTEKAEALEASEQSQAAENDRATTLQSERDELLDRVQTLESRVTESDAATQSAADQVKELNAKLEVLSTDNTQLNTTIESLTTERDQLTTNAKIEAKLGDKLQSELSQLNAEISQLKSDQEALQSELSTNQETLIDNQKILEKTEHSLLERDDAAKQLEHQNAAQADELNEARQSINTLEQSASDSAARISELEDSKISATEGAEQVSLELTKLTAELANTSTELSDERGQREALQAQIQDLRANADAAINDKAGLQSALSQANDEIAQWTDTLVKTERERDDLAGDADAHQRLLADNDALLAQNTQDLVSKSARIRELEQRLDGIGDDQSQLREELLLVREQARTSNAELAQREIELRQRQDEIDRLDSLMVELRSDLQARDKTIASIRSNVDKLGQIEANVRDLDHRMSREVDKTQIGPEALLIARIGGKTRRFELSDPEVTIGRTRDNHIQVRAAFVSRTHARLTANEEGWVIEDNGSKNGIYVNGELTRRHALEDNDKVMIGETLFTYMRKA